MHFKLTRLGKSAKHKLIKSVRFSGCWTLYAWLLFFFSAYGPILYSQHTFESQNNQPSSKWVLTLNSAATKRFHCTVCRLMRQYAPIRYISDSSPLPFSWYSGSSLSTTLTCPSSSVQCVVSTSRGTRAVHRCCVKAASTPSAGTVCRIWMWVSLTKHLTHA